MYYTYAYNMRHATIPHHARLQNIAHTCTHTHTHAHMHAWYLNLFVLFTQASHSASTVYVATYEHILLTSSH